MMSTFQTNHNLGVQNLSKICSKKRRWVNCALSLAKTRDRGEGHLPLTKVSPENDTPTLKLGRDWGVGTEVLGLRLWEEWRVIRTMRQVHKR